ncbi:endo-alpha-N-acetylgalactosaminidase family protein [Staphylococcus lutrae]|uniref:Glycoside hydrolase n=1 Tax=Staphylococcus lutrae TaxID=155085 RepID=A0AAC9RSD9_9STAP|nr:endo-alpha-N-acetylgalactosaminidase family protein [Staphylococcus lutrae]ARJ50816.1 glycoside hydrolase [Staphylococcus lutrae]PNZ39776.1 glycoside hydrolase [Staphylococcus lutrae]
MVNQQKQNYGIRKYAIGTSSVLLGVTLFISHAAHASAAEITAANSEQDLIPHISLHEPVDTLASDNTTTRKLDQDEPTQSTEKDNAASQVIDKIPTQTDTSTEQVTTATQPTRDNGQSSPQTETGSSSHLKATNDQVQPEKRLSTDNAKEADVSRMDPLIVEDKTTSTPLTTSPPQDIPTVEVHDIVHAVAPLTPISEQPENDNQVNTSAFAALPRENVQISNPQQTLTRAAVTQESSDIDTLTSEDMIATIDKKFPAVKGYTLKNGKKVPGQVVDARQIIVNNEVITPTVNYQKVDAHTAEYELIAQNEARTVDVTFKIRLSIVNRTVDLEMLDYVNHLTDPNHIIRNFAFVDQSLVSINSQQQNATLQTTKMSTNTMQSGDRAYTIDHNFAENFTDYMMYGFVSNHDYSAGLWSNAQMGVGGDQDFLRVVAQAISIENGVSVGLGAMPWIIQPSPEHPNAKAQGLLPHVKIAIAEDENQDGEINWQDGAIAYRAIMNNPYGYEEVPELVGYRIAMNFGSQAQNPFLKTLDGVKKFYLNTDGLGQSILLKGYNSEGHDSGHLDYANIGQRMGGAKDFNTLLKKGADYGARFGIHINASETYPESKVFNPDLLMKHEDGTYSYGWNWLDQGFNIDADYDLTHGRQKRFQALKDIVGDRLDFIYVDVWGNGQSGDNTAWPSHQLAKELNDLGWRVGVEWGHGMEYDSTFQHWAADLTYGGFAYKGINSEVARFIRNHQKDSWVGDYSSYSGAAEFPLLGGYSMKDFEGWQGRNDYASYIKNIFNVDLPTKFLQHYKVMRIKDGHPVKMTANNQTIDWTPEMQVDLQNDAGDQVTVTRKSNDYENDLANYRSRTITLNGQTVLDGETYLLPWNWDAQGQPLTGDQQKLYHWNKNGGTTTWTLPDTWQTNQVVVYELTETGRLAPRIIPVQAHQITLDDIKAETPYVIYPTIQPDNTDVHWSEGVHVTDTGFNSQQLSSWTITGDAPQVSITKSVSSNDMLKIDSPAQETQLTQSLTDLVPGQRYALYVGVDNRSQALTHIRVSHQGKTLASNQTGQSIAKNYVKADAHNTSPNSATYPNGESYFQNMYLYFVAPEDGQVDFTIQRDAGEGATYFDDIRVVENDAHLYRDGVFYQDFENVPQGLFPFVVSEAEGVEDNRIHLSEKNAPYTQRGWNHKRVNDVIAGQWSLKVNGQTEKNKMLIQTIPQNFYFEPGAKYEVSFDYESGSDNTYAFATGSGDISKNRDFKLSPLENTIDQNGPQRVTFNITGDQNGQTWIGIYSTDVPADSRGVTNNNQINFEGTKDFILDNLTIRKLDAPSMAHPQDDPKTTQDTTEQTKAPDTLPSHHTASSDNNHVGITHEESPMHKQWETITETNMTASTLTHSRLDLPIANDNTHRVATHQSQSEAVRVLPVTTAPTQTVSAVPSNAAHPVELPHTGDPTRSERGPLMAVIFGAILTGLGIRKQHKTK